MEKQKKNEQLITDFTTGSVPKQLLIFAAPLFLSNMLQIVYNMADMVIVGRALGKVGLSAVAVGGDITNFLMFLAMGFSGAGQVIISQYIGANRRDQLGRFVGTMFTFLTICALLLSVSCLYLRESLMRLMHTPAESFDQALAYATVCMVGLVFIYGYNIVSAVLRGMGDSRHPFIFISIAALMNIFLDLLLVFGFHLGAMGAALATVVSQGFSFVCCAVFLWHSRERFGFEIKGKDFARLDREMLKQLIGLGVPMALKSASVQFSKLFVNSWINSYGVEVSAVAGIAGKFNNISNQISNAVNTAGSSMVGQNIGAEKYERVPRILITCAAIMLTVATTVSAVLLLFPTQVFGFFMDEAEVLAVAMEFLPIAVLIFYGGAFHAPMNALVNGSGNYTINFITAILDGLLLRIGLALLFGLALNLRYIGFWLGDALASFTPFWLGMIYYLSGAWRTRKYLIKDR